MLFRSETLNKQIFFSQYSRIASYFEGMELAWHATAIEGEAPEQFVTAAARPASGPLPQGAELAILDVREEGLFAKGHLLFAASLPLSRLELTIRARVPRLGARIVLYDDGDGLAQRAAAKLRAIGYRKVAEPSLMPGLGNALPPTVEVG